MKRALVAAAIVGILHVHPAAAAEPHAPSVAHKVYPAATQKARDWAWKRLGARQWDCLDQALAARVRLARRGGAHLRVVRHPAGEPGDEDALAPVPTGRRPRMTQVRWGLGYIHGRYGTACNAWAHSRAWGWY